LQGSEELICSLGETSVLVGKELVKQVDPRNIVEDEILL